MRTTQASPIIQYDKEQLLHIRSLVYSTFSPRPTNNGEYPWLGLPVAVPGERRQQRKWGLRTGVLVRLRKRENWPLSSIILANVQSLDNKLDELRSRMAFQQHVKNCNVMVCTETWLDPSTPDSATVPRGSPFTARTRKKIRGGAREEVSVSWLTTSGAQMWSCSLHLEHLMIRCWPYYQQKHQKGRLAVLRQYLDLSQMNSAPSMHV